MCAHDTCTAAAMAFQKTGYGGQESHDSCQVLQGLESSTYKVHATLRGMRMIYQTNINKLSNFMNILTFKSAENIPTYLRFLTLKDDWCCYESAGKNQTAAALAPCSRHYTETFERLFWNILTKNSCRVITSAHLSILFITSHYICPWFLIVFQI